jgi:hypothetical protein
MLQTKGARESTLCLLGQLLLASQTKTAEVVSQLRQLVPEFKPEGCDGNET